MDHGRWTIDDRLSPYLYKFEQLKIYQLALDYIDKIYLLTPKLPRNEEFNLGSQIKRAATSIALNIAEGSTGQTDPEQARFLAMALRSVLETVAYHSAPKLRKNQLRQVI